MVEWDLSEDWVPSRQRPVNQYAMVRSATLVLGFLAALSFASGLMFSPAVERIPGRSQSPTEELAHILQRMRITADPRARERVVEGFMEDSKRLAQPLLEILRQPSHELILQAIECAGELGSVNVRSTLASLATSGSHLVRAAAVEAAEHLAPWTSRQLSDFLVEGPLPVRLAALRVAARRTDVPWDDVLALLTSEDAGVRAAALAAIPRRPPPHAVRVLDDMVLSGDADVAVAGLRALRRTQLAPEYDKVATDLLAFGDVELQRAALELLSSKGEPLVEPEVIWALARDPSAEMSIRARAIYCLERTGSYVASGLNLARGVDQLSPLLQYFTARCLVRSESPEGAELLFELIDSDVPQVAAASRQLLGELTGLAPTASAGRFRESLAHRHVAWRALPPPSIAY